MFNELADMLSSSELNKKGAPIHYIHPYFASFNPSLARIFIQKFSLTGDTVLDPFCGSGTTLVESNLYGRNAIGIDSNPLACLISDVKTTKIEKSETISYSNILRNINLDLNALYRQTSLDSYTLTQNEIKLPPIPNINYWFSPIVLNELSIIKKNIEVIDDLKLRNIFYVALSSIITKVSNQQHETRYKRVDKNIKEMETFKHFSNKIKEIILTSGSFGYSENGSSAMIYNEDIRTSSSVLDSSIDLVVTSPPYLNAWDYNLYQKFRFYWLGFDPLIFKHNEIGDHLGHSYDVNSIARYMNDMFLALSNIDRMLKKQGYAVLVVGDAIVKGVSVDIGGKLADAASKIGLECVGNFAKSILGPHFSQKRSTRDKDEKILILKKID